MYDLGRGLCLLVRKRRPLPSFGQTKVWRNLLVRDSFQSAQSKGASSRPQTGLSRQTIPLKSQQ